MQARQNDIDELKEPLLEIKVEDVLGESGRAELRARRRQLTRILFRIKLLLFATGCANMGLGLFNIFHDICTEEKAIKKCHNDASLGVLGLIFGTLGITGSLIGPTTNKEMREINQKIKKIEKKLEKKVAFLMGDNSHPHVLNKPISRSFFKHELFDRNLVPVIFDYMKEEKQNASIVRR